MAELRAAASRPRGANEHLTAADIATIAVAPGDGLARVFESLGASLIIPGGQTMNPSTEDFVKAMQSLPCERAILLPNNGNVVMAARQAADLAGRQAVVVPTKTVPQGIAAMLAFNTQADLDANARSMAAAARNVRTAEITVATRSVEVNGVQVKAGQPIGLLDDALTASGASIDDVVWKMLEQMQAAERELATMYYGAGVSANDANALADAIRARYANLEIEVVEGGQPHYPYIFSLE
jgi:dihydroxyacetone kinase-like predicted kinase